MFLRSLCNSCWSPATHGRYGSEGGTPLLQEKPGPKIFKPHKMFFLLQCFLLQSPYSARKLGPAGAGSPVLLVRCAAVARPRACRGECGEFTEVPIGASYNSLLDRSQSCKRRAVTVMLAALPAAPPAGHASRCSTHRTHQVQHNLAHLALFMVLTDGVQQRRPPWLMTQQQAGTN